MDDELFTVQEAAMVSGLKEENIRIAIGMGKLPYDVKSGRQVVSRADLESYKAKTKSGRSRKQHIL